MLNSSCKIFNSFEIFRLIISKTCGNLTRMKKLDKIESDLSQVHILIALWFVRFEKVTFWRSYIWKEVYTKMSCSLGKARDNTWKYEKICCHVFLQISRQPPPLFILTPPPKKTENFSKFRVAVVLFLLGFAFICIFFSV